jgi:hypothetical protein
MLIVDHERLTRTFFRRVNSTELFRLFFEEFEAWETMGLDKKATSDDIHAAWEELSSPNRREIDEALSRINDIAREKGRFTLHLRAETCGVEDFGDLTLQKLAMILFLDHRAVFDEAYDFYVLEKTDNLHTLLGRQAVACKPSDARLAKFKTELSKALRREAHGPQLLIEVAPPHPEKWMAAIPHQTFVKPDHEFNERNEIVTRDRRPVYEMVLIYYPKTGLLKLKAGRGRKKIEHAAAVFATEVLGQDADFFQICEVVNFEPLLAPHFAFPTEPGDHFEWARPTQIRFSKHAHAGVDYHVHCKDLYDGVPGVLATLAADGIDLSEIDIQGLSICFKFPRNKRDTRTVELGRPNRVSLDETERDRYIESVLARWGLIDHAAKDRLARAGLAG